MLDLDFDAEQDMLRETVRGVCATHSPLSVVRQLEDDPVGYPTELWKQLGKLDLIGLLLPEEYGGAGMTLIEGVVLYEELGRSLAPTPHFVSAVLCGGALARAGSADAAGGRGWGPSSPARPSSPRPGSSPRTAARPTGIQVRAAPDGDGFRISGTKRHVAFASSAARLVVLARTGDAPADVDLFLVDPGGPGRHPDPAADHRLRRPVPGGPAPTSPSAADDRIGAAGSGWATWDAVMHDGCILLGAQAMGGARHALDITVQYSKDRFQFDKPLGAFQALAHYMADAADHRRRGDHPGPRSGLGRRHRPTGRPARPHGQALRLPDLPRRHGHGPTGLRRHRLHRRVRHPALLPPGQAAPDLVVGHPLPRGAGGGGRPRPPLTAEDDWLEAPFRAALLRERPAAGPPCRRRAPATASRWPDRDHRRAV